MNRKACGCLRLQISGSVDNHSSELDKPCSQAAIGLRLQLAFSEDPNLRDLIILPLKECGCGNDIINAQEGPSTS